MFFEGSTPLILISYVKYYITLVYKNQANKLSFSIISNILIWFISMYPYVFQFPLNQFFSLLHLLSNMLVLLLLVCYFLLYFNKIFPSFIFFVYFSISANKPLYNRNRFCFPVFFSITVICCFILLSLFLISSFVKYSNS